MNTTPTATSRQQYRLWPISRSEYPKFLPLLLLKASISFVFSVLGSLKDPLVIMGGGGSAEVLPSLKIAVLLTTIIFALVYAHMVTRFSPSRIFYTICSSFALFLLLYLLFLYPYITEITPQTYAERLRATYPACSHYIAFFCNWPHTLFYIVAESWGQIGIFLLYWGTVNEVCTVEEAKRAYPLFIMAGCIGGLVGYGLSLVMSAAYPAKEDYDYVVYTLLIASIALMIGMQCLYWWLQRNLAKGAIHDRTLQQHRDTKLSFIKSIKFVASNPYLMAIATTVACCGLSMNLVDITWKSNVKLFCGSRAAMQFFLAKVNIVLLIVSVLTSLFLSGQIIRLFRWRVSAIASPIIITTTGVLFLFTSKWRYMLEAVAQGLHTTPLALVVWLGASQAIMSKLVKYTFFDVCKEIIYIPLDTNTKRKGKPAADMIGSRLGKSLSGVIHNIAITLGGTGSVLSVTIIIIPFLLLTATTWFYAIAYLDKELTKRTTKQE